MAKDDNVMREWDEAAESFTNFVREGKDYFREDLNNPAAFRLIGNVKGKRVPECRGSVSPSPRTEI